MDNLQSPDNVQWGTTKVPWVIKSYNPWDIIKITTMLPSVVLSGKRTNVPGLLLVPHWPFTTILIMLFVTS
jgi:hypothetical protein